MRSGCAREEIGRLRGRSTLAARASERGAAKPRGPNAPARARDVFHGGCGDGNARARGARGGAGRVARRLRVVGRGRRLRAGGGVRARTSSSRFPAVSPCASAISARLDGLVGSSGISALGDMAGVAAGRPARVPSAAMTTERAARLCGKTPYRGPARFNARADCFGDAVDACARWFDARARSRAITCAPEALQILIRAASRPSARALCPLIRPRVRGVVRSRRARIKLFCQPARSGIARKPMKRSVCRFQPRQQIRGPRAKTQFFPENAPRAAVRRVTNPRFRPIRIQ